MSVIVAVCRILALGGHGWRFADGIDPGLWKIISRTETGGVIGPPHESVEMPDRRADARPRHDIFAGADAR